MIYNGLSNDIRMDSEWIQNGFKFLQDGRLGGWALGAAGVGLVINHFAVRN
jgi:hypothetical protein